MAAMPPDLQEVFSLFELDGLTKHEVAALLGIPVGTAASRRARAQRVVVTELRRSVASQSSPCVAARSHLFVAGRDWYGSRGTLDRYLDALDGEFRDQWGALATSSWVPLRTAMGAALL